MSRTISGRVRDLEPSDRGRTRILLAVYEIAPKLRQRVKNFERVLNAYHPTATDPRLIGWRRSVLRALSGWRYRTGFYGAPYELRALQKLFHYQRPETAGF